jgi:hypothetical protein
MASDVESLGEGESSSGGHLGTNRRWFTQTKAFALRNLRQMLRTKATIIWGFGFPAFWYFLTSLLFLPDAGS